MQSIRRAAFRSALSASRAVSVKAPTTPFASTIARAATASKLVSFSSVRFYSQEPVEQTEQAEQAEQSSAEIQEASQETAEVVQPEATSKPSVPPNTHTAFVRNLVFEVTETHLKEAFEKYGAVLDTHVVRDPRGMSKGFGFVTFDSKEALDAACANVNSSFWHGRRITCIPRTYTSGKAPGRGPSNPAARPPTSQLFVGNIPYETTDTELNKIFKGINGLRDVRIAVDRTTGWPRGFAHADFADVDSAKIAHERLQGVTIGDRTLRVDFAEGYQKKRSNDSE
ncbi:hypothetical protein QBC43DRAFT_364967 [Cladorrhinum sp. PSN259]|nr:hypothetical protein QBC43DRAFT_364967 [Cladorrhinum sp. PSN259]